MVQFRTAFVLSALVVALSVGATAAAQARGPEDVIRAYYQALNAGDAEAAAALIAPAARIQTPSGTPATSVQNFVRAEIGERTPVEIIDLQVNGNQVTWVETRTGTNGASLGPRGTAVVENSLIRSLEFRPPVEVFGGAQPGLTAPQTAAPTTGPAAASTPPVQPAAETVEARPAEATALPPVPGALPRTGNGSLPVWGALGGLAAAALGWVLRRRQNG